MSSNSNYKIDIFSIHFHWFKITNQINLIKLSKVGNSWQTGKGKKKCAHIVIFREFVGFVYKWGRTFWPTILSTLKLQLIFEWTTNYGI